MTRSRWIAGLVLLSFSAPAFGQESGGLGLDPSVKDGPHGIAQPMRYTPLPLVTAHDLQNGMTAADHQAQNQNMITRLRGDPGYLAGFSMGTPLAASRQVQTVQQDDGGYWARHGHRHSDRPIVINNEGPLALTVGNGNVVQQQSAIGSGPIAQQQVATTPTAGSHSSGALNLVTGSGNIIQRAPGGN